MTLVPSQAVTSEEVVAQFAQFSQDKVASAQSVPPFTAGVV
jgi:hypothetical protein